MNVPSALRRRPMAPPLQPRTRPPVMAPAPPAAPALVDSTERNAEGWTRAELAQVEALAAEKYAALRKVDIEAEAEKRARDLYKATHGVAA